MSAGLSLASFPFVELPRQEYRPLPFEARDRILTAVRLLLAASSFDKLSMESVARAARVTRRTIYNQFADKSSMYRASRHQLLQDLAEMASAEVPERMSAADGLRFFAQVAHDVLGDSRNIELLGSLVRDAECQPWLIEAYDRSVRRSLLQTCENHVLRHMPGSRPAGDARVVAGQFINVVGAIAAGPRLLAGQLSSPAETDRQLKIVADSYASLLAEETGRTIS